MGDLTGIVLLDGLEVKILILDDIFPSWLFR